MDMRLTPAGLPAAPAGESLLRSVGREASQPGRMLRERVTTFSTEDLELLRRVAGHPSAANEVRDSEDRP